MHYPQRMLVRELADCPSAEDAARRLAGRPGLAWLDGDGSPMLEGRYSFVGVEPIAREVAATGSAQPFAVLDAISAEACAGEEPCVPAAPQALPEQVVPRWIGYLAYPPGRHGAEAAPPALCFARYDALVAFDHEQGRAYLVGDDEAACDRLQAKLRAPALALHARIGAVLADDPAQHAAAIETALQHLARGDIYQVNLARSFVASYVGEPLALALAMREQSPVPLGFFFDDGERSLVARTMERFLRWQRPERSLVTKPIKGTIARTGRDAAEAQALVSDPKERAEHTMIIDLMRNDLGRVAVLGSVVVPEVMVVERYAKLSHLVSTVRCVTRPTLGAAAVVEATFPPGSVTGTPKVRAMQIIDALESLPRGVYTGAVGYVDRCGGLSLAVAIRTATVERGQARYFAGGGIVEASLVERELAETELKARVFLDAAESLRTQAARAPSAGPRHDDVALSHAPLLR